MGHYEWYRDYAETAAKITWDKVTALFPRVPDRLAARVKDLDLPVIVAVIGEKDDSNPLRCVIRARNFDPLRQDYRLLNLGPRQAATMNEFATAAALARGAAS